MLGATSSPPVGETVLQQLLCLSLLDFAEGPQDLLRAEAACRDWREELQQARADWAAWRRLCAEHFPTMTARLVAAETSDCPAAWRESFQRRFEKQRSWDWARNRQRKSQAGTSPDFPVVLRGGRCKTCRRCGVEFAPGGGGECQFHPGRFAAMSEDGVVATSGVPQGRAFERKAQGIIRAHNRRKSSKRANAVVFGKLDEGGVARADGISWRWSCCGEENLVAVGCARGAHR